MKSLLMRLDRPPVARGAAVAAAAALLTVAVVHLIDGPESLEDQFYVGALELALTAACVTLAIGLILRPTRDTWIASATIVVLALLLYVLSGPPGCRAPATTWAIGGRRLESSTSRARRSCSCWRRQRWPTATSRIARTRRASGVWRSAASSKPKGLLV